MDGSNATISVAGDTSINRGIEGLALIENSSAETSTNVIVENEGVRKWVSLRDVSSKTEAESISRIKNNVLHLLNSNYNLLEKRFELSMEMIKLYAQYDQAYMKFFLLCESTPYIFLTEKIEEDPGFKSVQGQILKDAQKYVLNMAKDMIGFCSEFLKQSPSNHSNQYRIQMALEKFYPGVKESLRTAIIPDLSAQNVIDAINKVTKADEMFIKFSDAPFLKNYRNSLVLKLSEECKNMTEEMFESTEFPDAIRTILSNIDNYLVENPRNFNSILATVRKVFDPRGTTEQTNTGSNRSTSGARSSYRIQKIQSPPPKVAPLITIDSSSDLESDSLESITALEDLAAPKSAASPKAVMSPKALKSSTKRKIQDTSSSKAMVSVVAKTKKTAATTRSTISEKSLVNTVSERTAQLDSAEASVAVNSNSAISVPSKTTGNSEDLVNTVSERTAQSESSEACVAVNSISTISVLSKTTGNAEEFAAAEISEESAAVVSNEYSVSKAASEAKASIPKTSLSITQSSVEVQAVYNDSLPLTQATISVSNTQSFRMDENIVVFACVDLLRRYCSTWNLDFNTILHRDESSRIPFDNNKTSFAINCLKEYAENNMFKSPTSSVKKLDTLIAVLENPNELDEENTKSSTEAAPNNSDATIHESIPVDERDLILDSAEQGDHVSESLATNTTGTLEASCEPSKLDQLSEEQPRVTESSVISTAASLNAGMVMGEDNINSSSTEAAPVDERDMNSAYRRQLPEVVVSAITALQNLDHLMNKHNIRGFHALISESVPQKLQAAVLTIYTHAIRLHLLSLEFHHTAECYIGLNLRAHLQVQQTLSNEGVNIASFQSSFQISPHHGDRSINNVMMQMFNQLFQQEGVHMNCITVALRVSISNSVENNKNIERFHKTVAEAVVSNFAKSNSADKSLLFVNILPESNNGHVKTIAFPNRISFDFGGIQYTYQTVGAVYKWSTMKRSTSSSAVLCDEEYLVRIVTRDGNTVSKVEYRAYQCVDSFFAPSDHSQYCSPNHNIRGFEDFFTPTVVVDSKKYVIDGAVLCLNAGQAQTTFNHDLHAHAQTLSSEETVGRSGLYNLRLCDLRALRNKREDLSHKIITPIVERFLEKLHSSPDYTDCANVYLPGDMLDSLVNPGYFYEKDGIYKLAPYKELAFNRQYRILTEKSAYKNIFSIQKDKAVFHTIVQYNTLESWMYVSFSLQDKWIVINDPLYTSNRVATVTSIFVEYISREHARYTKEEGPLWIGNIHGWVWSTNVKCPQQQTPHYQAGAYSILAAFRSMLLSKPHIQEKIQCGWEIAQTKWHVTTYFDHMELLLNDEDRDSAFKFFFDLLANITKYPAPRVAAEMHNRRLIAERVRNGETIKPRPKPTHRIPVPCSDNDDDTETDGDDDGRRKRGQPRNRTHSSSPQKRKRVG